MMTINEQYEVVKAAKEGRAVERLSSSGLWFSFTGIYFDFVQYTYRVKRVPLELWLNVYDNKSTAVHSTRELAFQLARPDCLRVAVHMREVE